MPTRIVQMVVAIAVLVLALTMTRTEAFAHSDKESCSETSTNVGKMNADGTGVSCDAETGAPNKATAKASDLGTAGTAGSRLAWAMARANSVRSVGVVAATAPINSSHAAKTAGA